MAHKKAKNSDEATKLQEPYEGHPHGWVQWKGTDVCMDVYCSCGYHSHVDAWFAYYVQCPNCKKIYQVNPHVELIEVVGCTESHCCVTDERPLTADSMCKPMEEQKDGDNPYKVTEDAAINRDTDAERELLEELHEDSFLHLNIKCCSRCGENHGDVPALPLDRTSDEWSHYALCPTNGQPIMIATAEGDYVLLEDALEKAFEAICSGDGSDMKAYLRVLMVAMRPAWFDEHGDPVAMEDK